MAAETKRDCVEVTIRAFRSEDAVAVARILREAPEAANWPEEGYREALKWPGVTALVGEDHEKVTGFIVGRQVADQAEILNLAVAPASRRRGEGEALLKAALEECRSHGVSRVCVEGGESSRTGMACDEKHGVGETGSG